MIKRHYEVSSLMETMGPYEKEIQGFYPEEWLADLDNICLTDGNGNFTLFEATNTKGVYYGHYFLKARGREALRLCEEFLATFFSQPDAVTIMGITPLYKKGALWMNRKLGFKPLCVTDTIVGPCQLVILSKKEWEAKNE